MLTRPLVDIYMILPTLTALASLSEVRAIPFTVRTHVT
jgi:hypothetical protein